LSAKARQNLPGLFGADLVGSTLAVHHLASDLGIEPDGRGGLDADR
jgi:hypothetical protein